MNITEIGSWLKNRYDAKIVSHTECFIIQAICKENIFFDLSDRQSAVFLMYCEEIPANGLPENEIILLLVLVSRMIATTLIVLRFTSPLISSFYAVN